MIFFLGKSEENFDFLLILPTQKAWEMQKLL